jgi:hypothetical protein
MIAGLGLGMWLQMTHFPIVEDDTVIICDTDLGNTAFTAPGMHFCPSGKWTSFRLHEQVSFQAEVHLRDGQPISVKGVANYSLPSKASRLIEIYEFAPDQMALNEGVVRSIAVRQLGRVFSQLDEEHLLIESNLQRVGTLVADGAKAELMLNWRIELESLWFTGTGKVFTPAAYRPVEHSI